MPSSRIVDGPNWVRTERYDVDARAAEEVPESQVPVLLQRMLQERFKVAVHREMKEVPVYALVPARSDRRLGPRLQPSSTDCADPEARKRQLGSASPACGFTIGTGRIVAGSTTLDTLAQMLANPSGRPILNRTEMSGSYNVELEWAPIEDASGSEFGSIFTEIQEQLGLKLEPTSAVQDVLVIDSVERPSEN
jgi:uncharacterized protein (TIGR03435 family)